MANYFKLGGIRYRTRVALSKVCKIPDEVIDEAVQSGVAQTLYGNLYFINTQNFMRKRVGESVRNFNHQRRNGNS